MFAERGIDTGAVKPKFLLPIFEHASLEDDSAHHGINSAHPLIHCANAVDVFDVHVHITTGSAHADDFMSTRQGRYYSFANGTGGTHDDYFHHYILTEAAWRLFAERSADRDEARRDEPCAREHSECISSVVISEEANRADTA